MVKSLLWSRRGGARQRLGAKPREESFLRWAGSGDGVDLHVVSEGLKTAQESASFCLGAVVTGVVVGTELDEGDPVVKHVPSRHQDDVCRGNCRALLAATGANPSVAHGEIAAPGASGGERSLDERLLQPRRAGTGGAAAALSGGLVVTRTQPCP